MATKKLNEMQLKTTKCAMNAKLATTRRATATKGNRKARNESLLKGEIETESKFAGSSSMVRWDPQVTLGAAIEFASAKRITQLATGEALHAESWWTRSCLALWEGEGKWGHACCNFR